MQNKSTSSPEVLWELFHENSKVSHSGAHPTYRMWPSDTAIVDVMNNLQAVQAFTDYPKVTLPANMPCATKNFDAVLTERASARCFSGGFLNLAQVAKVLFMAYGITYSKAGTRFPRDLRTIPSGGALYPLEIFLTALRVSELEDGLYHYNPEAHNLDTIATHAGGNTFNSLFVQQEPANSASVVLYVAAYFARTTFKYGDRGYRFALLEAGHLAQNAILTATEMGVASATLGGYFDRDVDRYLGLDGINQSVIYTLLLGTGKLNRDPVDQDSIR